MTRKPLAIKLRPIQEKGKRLKQHGAREMERRRLQIWWGQLKVENGLENAK